MEKQITETKKKVETINERFALGIIEANIYQQFSVTQSPEYYFEDQASYIISERTYPLSNWLIKPYPHPKGEDDDGDVKRIFNTLLSSARVNVEHGIGLLKV